MAKAKTQSASPADVVALLGLDPDTPWSAITVDLDWGAPAEAGSDGQPDRPQRPAKVSVTATALGGDVQAHKQIIEEVPA